MELIKKITILFLTTLCFCVNAQVDWYTFEEAFEAQKVDPKPIMVDAYTVWCGPCKLLDKNTFGNKDVSDYLNTNFYPVKFNAEGNDVVRFQGKVYDNPNYDPQRAKSRNSAHNLTRYLGVTGYPTLVFFDKDGNYITPAVGYINPKQIEIYLKLIYQQDYLEFKNADDFTAYIKAFKNQFKG
jgi:thioredoxin-related protein